MTLRAGESITANFISDGALVLIELRSMTDQPLRCVEILTIFLKDEETLGGPARANIKFKAIKCLQPKERVVLSHQTWVDGKPTAPSHDLLERLKLRAGGERPYVLDISWEDAEGESRFQRIPVVINHESGDISRIRREAAPLRSPAR